MQQEISFNELRYIFGGWFGGLIRHIRLCLGPNLRFPRVFYFSVVLLLRCLLGFSGCCLGGSF